MFNLKSLFSFILSLLLALTACNAKPVLLEKDKIEDEEWDITLYKPSDWHIYSNRSIFFDRIILKSNLDGPCLSRITIISHYDETQKDSLEIDNDFIIHVEELIENPKKLMDRLVLYYSEQFRYSTGGIFPVSSKVQQKYGRNVIEIIFKSKDSLSGASGYKKHYYLGNQGRLFLFTQSIAFLGVEEKKAQFQSLSKDFEDMFHYAEFHK